MRRTHFNPRHLVITMRTFTVSFVAAVIAATVANPLVAAENALPQHARCIVEQGQQYIEQGRYEQAIREFTCVIEQDPTGVEGYRGRIEAALLLGRYSDALGDYARVTANVLPVHPDGRATILAGYAARLAAAPDDITALMGASFARWSDFEYLQTIHLLNHLLEVEPNNVFGNLFRGSSRLLKGVTGDKGVADIERALALAPQSADVRFIVADAYTYGLSEPERAFVEASFALDGGLDTPRVHAILATSYHAFGDDESASLHLLRHFELVTTELVPTAPLPPNTSVNLSLAPGRVYEIPVLVVAGETLAITTSSRDYWDTIAVLLAPDGTPVTGSDDENAYFAAFEWVAKATATYRLRVTFFESVNSGELVVVRD
jgi:tetratricopeptide (TPR) repeat protein